MELDNSRSTHGVVRFLNLHCASIISGYCASIISGYIDVAPSLVEESVMRAFLAVLVVGLFALPSIGLAADSKGQTDNTGMSKAVENSGDKEKGKECDKDNDNDKDKDKDNDKDKSKDKDKDMQQDKQCPVSEE
jgi:hypothetical protein